MSTGEGHAPGPRTDRAPTWRGGAGLTVLGGAVGFALALRRHA